MVWGIDALLRAKFAIISFVEINPIVGSELK